MNKHLMAIILCLTLGSALTHAGDGWAVDAAKSKVGFTILNRPPNAADFGPVEGSFKQFGGTFLMDTAQPEKSFARIEVRTASIDTANGQRDDHLRNQDFFKVKEFPVMTFASTSVKPLDGGKFEVTGDFTLLGVTRQVSAVFELTGERTGTAAFRIKRSDYGMTYRIPDTADEVDVVLEIVGAAE